jgi:hypothetical protein
VADTATIDAQTNHVVYYVCRQQHLSCIHIENQNVDYINGPFQSVELFKPCPYHSQHLRSLYGFLLFGAVGARGGAVAKALRYKPAGRGFDSQLCHWNFSLT